MARGFVIDEIEATDEPNLKRRLENLFRGFEILEITEERLKLSDVYLSYRRLPPMDARHIAIASLGDRDFLLTSGIAGIFTSVEERKWCVK